MSASGGIELHVDQDGKDETRKVEKFEDGDFPALRPNYDWRAHAHHTVVLLIGNPTLFDHENVLITNLKQFCLRVHLR